MSAPRPETALFDLLCELFDGRELVRFASQTYGRELLQSLPDQGSLGDIAFALIGLLSRRALIQPALFDALVAARPGRYSQIAAVAMRWNIALPAVVDVPIVGSPSHASVAPPLDAAEGTTSPESWHAFISYAREDVRWVRMLAANLHRLDLDVFFDEWEVDAGTVVAARLDEGLRASRAGVLVVSKTSVERPWVLEEYAALLRNAVERGQRLIPVLLEDAAVPAMLATRLCVDFRGKHGQDYLDAVRELAAAIRGERSRRPARGSRLEIP